MTRPSPFRPKLHRLVVIDIELIEEHVANRRRLLVDLERVTGEDESLGRDARRVRGEEGPSADEVDHRILCRRRDSKEDGGLGPERDGEVGGRDLRLDAVPEEPLELVHVVSALAATADGVLREDGVDEEPAWAEEEDEGVLRADGLKVLGVALDGEVHDRVLVLVLEETEDDEGEGGVVASEEGSGDVLDVEDDARSGLPPTSSAPASFEHTASQNAPRLPPSGPSAPSSSPSA